MPGVSWGMELPPATTVTFLLSSATAQVPTCCTLSKLHKRVCLSQPHISTAGASRDIPQHPTTFTLQHLRGKHSGVPAAFSRRLRALPPSDLCHGLLQESQRLVTRAAAAAAPALLGPLLLRAARCSRRASLPHPLAARSLRMQKRGWQGLVWPLRLQGGAQRLF